MESESLGMECTIILILFANSGHPFDHPPFTFQNVLMPEFRPYTFCVKDLVLHFIPCVYFTFLFLPLIFFIFEIFIQLLYTPFCPC